MRQILNISRLICISILLSACLNFPETGESPTSAGWYQVRPSDTLYSIAWRYGLDYKELANWNSIDVNGIIYPGQKLLLIKPENPVVAPNVEVIVASPETVKPDVPGGEKSAAPVAVRDLGANPERWLWPVSGRVMNTFAANQLDRRGIDIAGTLGQAIVAVADGKVVYSGNGLAGYGNLVIIKHSETFLSAYAYIQERRVDEGMTVKAGSEIATMGQHKTQSARLHFEIRKNGQPVDPMQYLPQQ